MAINWNTLKQLALSSKEGMDITTLPSFPKFVDTPTPKTPSKPAVRYWGGAAKPVQKPVAQQGPKFANNPYGRASKAQYEQIQASRQNNGKSRQQVNDYVAARNADFAKRQQMLAEIKARREARRDQRIAATNAKIEAMRAKRLQQEQMAKQQAKYSKYGLGA